MKKNLAECAASGVVRDFEGVRRLVVKVGTSLLRKADNSVDLPALRLLASQISELHAARKNLQIVVVSSGAVGFGLMRLGMSRRPSDVATLQAIAAIGQPLLMQAWTEAFSPFKIHVSQLLLTNDGLQDRRRFLNAKNALCRILDLGVVPIVNENDTVAVEELKFGDNDLLSALVASMIDADLLINLTDVDGFKDENGTVMRTVIEIRREWLKSSAVSAKNKGYSVGGMSAKLKSAQIALQSGIPIIIANGRAPGIIDAILSGSPSGTFFPADGGFKGKKRWVRFFTQPKGQIVIDRGACAAIAKNGKSLLPSGILRAAGTFPRRSCVSIVSEDGREIARGITYYSAEEVAAIAGLASSAIQERLGTNPGETPPEVVHRDDMAVMPHGENANEK